MFRVVVVDRSCYNHNSNAVFIPKRKTNRRAADYPERARDVSRSLFFFFSSRRRHTRLQGDWSSDVCSSDLRLKQQADTVKATESVQRAQATVAGRYAGSQTRVQSALDSLERIKQKQAERGARMESAAELARDSSEDALDAKLRAAGITPQAGNAQSVLERLKAQRAATGGKNA